MYCNVCRKQLPDGSATCSSCGGAAAGQPGSVERRMQSAWKLKQLYGYALGVSTLCFLAFYFLDMAGYKFPTLMMISGLCSFGLIFLGTVLFTRQEKRRGLFR